MMCAQLHQVQTELAAEQVTTAVLRQNIFRGGDSGIIGTIRRGQLKEVSPKKYTNMQVFGNFKAKDMKDYLFWHDRSIKELIECFDSNWTKDQRLSYAEKCCANRMLDVDVHSALRKVIAAFLEGESKILADTAEVSNPENMELHKSGLELWRLLTCNSDHASALNVISVLESIRNMQAAKNVQDVRLKLNALDRRHQEYCMHAVVEGARIRQHEDALHQRLPRSFQESRLVEGAS